MRIRATVAAVTGVLALSAFVVPAVQADERPAPGLNVPSGAEFSGGAPAEAGAPTAEADDFSGDIRITKVVVNGGEDIVLGTTAAKTFTIAVTATDDSGIETGNTFPVMWHTPLPNGGYYGLVGPEDIAGSCVRQSFTTTTCTHTLKINPRIHPQDNTTAGTWTVRTHALAKDGDYYTKDAAGKAKVLRNSRLTVNASPEPVRKNRTITVTGALTRASWQTYKYGGYTKQLVKLQFKKKGAKSYTTVKTVQTSSTGTLKTTVKASADGYWRYSFAGTSTTSAVSASGDYLDVK
ncbi:calcium-binding protein [Streptomyces sp. NPDC059698]|uniref:calcium-binding protein n=1 Tax=unclassified Streptomyces TaxID=2593676 RepID=UPI000966763F|nr:calcium-binding protein [Streptomyces sp. CB02366]OKJ25790.1 calcium-binding protein [Streptomyces sp. CB02366]